MAVPKFAIACIAALLAGTAAGFAGAPSPSGQVPGREDRVTPIAAIARPSDSFRGVIVRLSSGETVGRVLAVDTDAQGRAVRVKVALSGGASQWMDGSDLSYSRARDALVARDIRTPSMKVASR